MPSLHDLTQNAFNLAMGAQWQHLSTWHAGAPPKLDCAECVALYSAVEACQRAVAAVEDMPLPEREAHVRQRATA